jgi:hypothetical protein
MKAALRKDSKRTTQQAGMLANVEWCRQEFASIQLGDRRLNQRLIQTAAMLAQQPLASSNQACPSWEDSKAAYRLFANERVTAEEIKRSHQESTLKRIQGHQRILVIQDTTTVNYNNHPETEGLGPIGKRAGNRQPSQGLWMHTALAVAPHSSAEEIDGIPLGLIQQKVWVRPQKKIKRKSTGTPIEEKESYKWIELLQSTIQSVSPLTECVTVCDREGDIFEFMYFAQQRNAKFLVRNNIDRRLAPDERWDPQKDGKYGVKPDNTIRNKMKEQPCAATMEIQVPRKAGLHPERTATVEVRFTELQFGRPTWPAKLTAITDRMGPVRVHAIWVKEVNPPQEVVNPDPKVLEQKRKKSPKRRKIPRGENPLAPLEWMLLTNVWITGLEDAMERVRWYEQRWQIECFHKVLKSGCAVEKCRLQYADRLEKYLALSSIIAWRLYWMSRLSRKAPEMPANQFLSETEWKALWCKIHRRPDPPSEPPTIRQSVRWIAQLGGFLGRKSDGEPGTTTLWRGWQRLHDITEDWIIFRKQLSYG